MLITGIFGLIFALNSGSETKSGTPAEIETAGVSAGCDEATQLCTCVAAGGCMTTPGSACRIEFCSGHIEINLTNSADKNITVVSQPCPDSAPGEGN